MTLSLNKIKVGNLPNVFYQRQNTAISFHVYMCFVAIVLVAFAYVGGLIAANSHFTDINDVIEITGCQAATAEECGKISTKVLAWYFVPTQLMLMAPMSVVGWIVIGLGRCRSRWGLFPWLPWLWLLGLTLLYMMPVSFVDVSEKLGLLFFIMLMYTPALIIISGLHATALQKRLGEIPTDDNKP